METSPRSLPRGDAASSSTRVEKNVGSGSSESSIDKELGRLSEENAHYRRKISDLMGKAPAVPAHARTNSQGGGSLERMRQELRNLRRDNQRLTEANSTLERRVAGSRTNASSDQLWRYKEEVRTLRRENSELTKEKQRFDRTAEYVCQRVLKIIGAARREGNFNSQLVGELKRWNEKLEDENHRLYSIIERMQNKNSSSERDSAVAEADALSKNHDKDRDGNAALVKQLETQNVKLQEEISKLSDQAISLQNLSSSSSGSSGILPAPRTPSNHEQDATGRRSRTPERDALAASERLRSGELNRRKSRQLSLDSVSSAAAQREMENEQLRQEKKNLEEEIGRIGAHLQFIREEASLSKELQQSNAQQNAEIQKLTEASTRVKALEDAAVEHAAEVDRLLAVQKGLQADAEAGLALKEEYQELEDDCLKLAAEVERLQPFAEKVAELEARVESYQQELAGVREEHESEEVARVKADNLEVQRTLEALAAEKSVLQAQLRELMEERARLSSENKSLDMQVKLLQEKVNEAVPLRTELAGMKQIKGQNATYRNQMGALRSENTALQRKASDLARQIAEFQANGAASGMLRGNESRIREVSSKDNVTTPPTSPSGGASSEEVAALQAQCKELQGEASRAVELTVEITSLRNKIKTYEEAEEHFREQKSLLQQLKAENAALQKDAAATAALKLEIADLRRQVSKAEESQKRSEKEMATLLSTTVHKELTKHYEERGREISALQGKLDGAAKEVSKREAQLSALQTKHDALVKEHSKVGGTNSEIAALHMALAQEKSETFRVSAEMAELHSLLQTGKFERQSLQGSLEQLRAENGALSRKVAELDARNDDQERTLAQVLARGEAPRRPSNDGPWPTTPGIAEAAPLGEGVGSPNGQHGGWQTPRGTPILKQMNGNGSLSEHSATNGASPAKTKKAGLRKEKSKGFGQFFKIGSGKKSEKGGAAVREGETVNSPTSAPEDERIKLDDDPEEEVIATYEQFVDKDDIDGFMSALGFPGFLGPTSPDDMEGAFASARYACRPEAAATGRSPRDAAKAEATAELLEAWQAAWQTAEAS